MCAPFTRTSPQGVHPHYKHVRKAPGRSLKVGVISHLQCAVWSRRTCLSLGGGVSHLTVPVSTTPTQWSLQMRPKAGAMALSLTSLCLPEPREYSCQLDGCVHSRPAHPKHLLGPGQEYQWRLTSHVATKLQLKLTNLNKMCPVLL